MILIASQELQYTISIPVSYAAMALADPVTRNGRLVQSTSVVLHFKPALYLQIVPFGMERFHACKGQLTQPRLCWRANTPVDAKSCTKAISLVVLLGAFVLHNN